MGKTPAYYVVNYEKIFYEENPNLDPEHIIARYLNRHNIKDVKVSDLMLYARESLYWQHMLNKLNEYMVHLIRNDYLNDKYKVQEKKRRDQKQVDQLKAEKLQEKQAFEESKKEFESKYPDLDIDKIPVGCSLCDYLQPLATRPQIKQEMQKPFHLRKTLFHIEKNARGELFDVCKIHKFLMPRAENSSCPTFEPNKIISLYKKLLSRVREREEYIRLREEKEKKEKEKKKQEIESNIQKYKSELDELIGE